MKYIVFYNNIEIGVLEINKKNQYKYTPNEKLTTEVKEKISLFPELLVQSEWGKPIPIFEICCGSNCSIPSFNISIHF